MSKALDRAKDLARKTNATVVVVNETSDDVFVVMTIDQYEKFISGSTQPTQKSRSVATESLSQAQPATRLQAEERPLASLTEQELLARMSEQVKEWRSAQVNREQLVLAEMPTEIKVSGTGDKELGKYNLSGKVDFRVDNLEDEERFFLDDLS